MTETENLNTPSEDNPDPLQSWAPLDALHAAIRDIEQGKVNPRSVYIAMREDNTNKEPARDAYYNAGFYNSAELVGLLAQHVVRHSLPK